MAVEFDDLLPRKRQPEALTAASTLDFSDLTGEPALGTAAASGNVAGTDIPSDPKSRIVGKVYTDTQGAPRRWNGASFDFGDAARETTALEVAGGTLGNIAQGFVRAPKAITDLANAVIPGRSYDFNTDAYNEAINAFEQAKPAAYRAEADNGGIIERTSDGRVVGMRAPSGEAVGGAIAQSLVQAPMFMAGGAGATSLASRVLPNLPRMAQFLGYGATNAALVAPGQGDDTRREALANGYDEATAARMGDQALLETGALTFGTGGAGGALSLFGGSTARSLPRALLRGGAAEVPFEAAEEAGQSAINDRALGQPVDWSRAADAGALGAFAGFASGAPLGGMEYLSHSASPVGAPVGQSPANQPRVEPTWRQTPQGLELDIVGLPDAVAPTDGDTESAIDALLTRNIPAADSRPAPVLDADRIASMLGDIVSSNPDAAAALAQSVAPTAAPAPAETAQPSPNAVGSGLGDGALLDRLFTPEVAAALGLPNAAGASPPSAPASTAPASSLPASAPVAPSAPATTAPASRAAAAGLPTVEGAIASVGSDMRDTNGLPVKGDGRAKAARKPAVKTDSAKKPIDLLRVIAANGGLNREAFRAQGVDPAEFTRRAGFNYVFRKDGGMSLPDLREFMQQEGYLSPDSETGRATVDDNDALDLFDRALRSGESIYSMDQAEAVARHREAQRQADEEFRADLAGDPSFEGMTDDEFEAMQAREIAELTERVYDLGASDRDIVSVAFDATNSERHRNGLQQLVARLENARAIDARSASEVGRGRAAPREEAQPEPGRPGFQLGTQSAPAESPREVAPAQTGLFGAPTARETVDAARRDKDANRDGKTSAGPTDIRSGDGELFAGARPEQVRVDAQRSDAEWLAAAKRDGAADSVDALRSYLHAKRHPEIDAAFQSQFGIDDVAGNVAHRIWQSERPEQARVPDATPTAGDTAAASAPAEPTSLENVEPTEGYRRWSNDAPLVTSAEAMTHEFRTGQKIVVEAFHGAKRPDRIGKGFNAKRATSGPMAYFTNSPDIASNYATNKSDTSLAYEDTDFGTWVKAKVPGARNPVPLPRAWWSLSPEARARIAELAPRVQMDDAAENPVLGPEGNRNGIGNYEWELRQARGNHLQALTESWLTSGSIYGEEDRFMDVLRLAGVPMGGLTYGPPHAEYPSVFPVKIAMQQPLVTSDIPADVRTALRDVAKRDRTRAVEGADSWDKRSITTRDWVANFERGDEYVWTQIPDKVTNALRALGYDGIVDVGGKGGGDKHKVYIPFSEGQVKGKFNRGGYDAGKRDLLANLDESNDDDFTYDPLVSDRADDWLQEAMADQSAAEGEADAKRLGLSDAVDALLKDAPGAPKVEFMRGLEGLPKRLREGIQKRAVQRGSDSKVRVAALYDTETSRVFVFTDIVKTPESAQWQVAHEIAGHHGLRTLLGDKLNKALELALQNPTVKLLADAIAKERKSNNRLLMAEESLAELAAAVRTGDFDKIAQRYGVTVPEGMRGGIKAAIENFLRRLKALFGQQGVAFKDAQVRELLEAAWQAVKDGGENRSDSDAGLESVDYTPEQQEFLRKSGLGGAVDQKTTLQRVTEWVQGKTPEFDKHSLVQSGLDHYYGIKRAATEKGGIPIERDPYIAARQINTASTMEAILRFGGPRLVDGALRVDRSVPALLDALKPVSNQMPQFLGWMVARRAKLLKAQGRERLMSDADIEAGLSLAKGHEAEFTKAALGYLKLKNSILDLAEQTGEIDPIARAAWDHAEYLPFYRDAETTTGAGTRQGLANQSAGIRSLKGGESALVDPLSNIIQNFTRLVDASMKNRAAMLAVDELGAPYFRPAALTVKPEAIPLDQVRKHLESTGVDAATIASMPESALKGVAKMLSIKAPEGDDIIRIMRGGKAEYYHVDDPLLLRSLTAFSEKPTHLAVKILQWQKNLLTAGATATMDFLLANGFRDTGEAAVTSQDRFIPVWDTLRGAIDSLRDSELSQDLMMAGSSFHSGLFRSGDTDATASAIRRALRKHSQSDDFIERYVKTLINPAKLLPRAWDGYRRLSEASEAGSRISLARLRLESGAPFIEAAHEAKDFLDFQLRGDDGFVQFFLKTIPFLNARAQGAYRLGRVGTTRRRVGKLAVGLATMAAASTALMLWNAAMYADDWDELEDWDKDANWHIAPGTKYHQRIPKPFELGYIGGTLPERVYAALRYQLTRGEEGDRPEQSLDSVMHLFTGTLMLNPVPQGVKPIFEDAFDKDFYFGSPIESMGDKYKAPSDRYGPTTSPTMREASKAMAAVLGEDRTLSPKRMAHLWRGYTAGMGQYALSAADMLTRTATDAPERPEMRMRDWPVIGRFARGGSPAPSTRYTEEFYDLDEKAGIQSRTIKEALKHGDEKRARQVEAEYGWLLGDRQSTKRATGGFMHSGVRELDRASREMAKLRKEDTVTYESRTMTPAEKRAALDANAKKRNDLARKMVRQARERERAAR